MRALEQCSRLLRNLFERMPDRGLWSGRDLQLCEHTVHAGYVLIHFLAVVAAHRGREANVAQLRDLRIGNAAAGIGGWRCASPWLVGLDGRTLPQRRQPGEPAKPRRMRRCGCVEAEPTYLGPAPVVRLNGSRGRLSEARRLSVAPQAVEPWLSPPDVSGGARRHVYRLVISKHPVGKRRLDVVRTRASRQRPAAARFPGHHQQRGTGVSDRGRFTTLVLALLVRQLVVKAAEVEEELKA